MTVPPCLSRATTSRRVPNWSSEEARTWGTPSSTNHTAAASQPTGSIARRQSVGCISRGSARPYTRRKDPPTLNPQNQVSEGDGTRYAVANLVRGLLWTGIDQRNTCKAPTRENKNKNKAKMTKRKEGLALGTRNKNYYIIGYYFCEQDLHDWLLFLFSVDFRLCFGVRLGRCPEGLDAFGVFFQNMSMYSTVQMGTLLLLFLIHTFGVLSFQLIKLR